MPAKLDRCVKQVMAQGRSKSGAFAICNASLGEAEWPEDVTEAEKAKVNEIMQEAMSHEETHQVLRTALQNAVGEMEFVWIIETFDTSVIYELGDDGGMFQRSYMIDEATNEVVLGFPQQVRRIVTFEPVDSNTESKKANVSDDTDGDESEIVEAVLIESADDSRPERRIGQLTEAAIRRDGTIGLKIVEPGWGSSGYYGAEMLERDAPTAFPKGTHMYWNHPTMTERVERPERDLSDFAAVLVSEGRFVQDGADGPGVYADAKVFEEYRDSVDELAPYIGISLRAPGSAIHGEAEGRKGPIIQTIKEADSVDFVTQAGAGGEIIELFESKRGLRISRPVEDIKMSDNDTKDKDQQVDYKGLLEAANKRIELLEERDAKRGAFDAAKELVTAKLSESKLPDITKVRVTKAALENVPMSEGILDTEKFTARLDDMIASESEYLKAIGGIPRSPVHGMGASSGDQTDLTESSDFDVDKELDSIFSEMGIEESVRKHAVSGR